jgi:quinol monooxygenase YgiN
MTSPRSLTSNIRWAVAAVGAAWILMFSSLVNAQTNGDIISRLEAAGRKTAPFALRTEITVRPGAAARFQALARDNSAATNGEERPVSFRFYQNAEAPEQFVLFQEWESLQGFARHLQQPHTAAFEAALQPLLASPPRRRLYRLPAEAAPGDGRAARAAVEAQTAAAPTASATGKRLDAVGMGSTQFVLFVDVPVKAGGAATMKDTALRVTAPTLAEPGSIRYGYYQDIDDPQSFLLFEHWRRFDDMVAHLELPHFQTLMKTFALVGGDGRKVGVFRPIAH